ncbi:MAG TPA: TonB-dependent receptor [Sphingomicrobium sp.]|nr:TonB-dependent receptor [Sphingomicrobium sp.]
MQHRRWSDLNRSALLVGISMGSLLAATPALAQAAPPPANGPSSQAPSDEQKPASQVPPQTSVRSSGASTAATDSGQTIVVTGSRIRQPEFSSPDPVSRIDPQVAKESGKLDLADTLQSSPIAAGSTQITSALSSNFVTNGGPGAETIDLRGLGPNRTLVLLNGRRAGPAGTRGGVSSFDLNVLPQSIIQSIDILKTGASSIYGSDAIAGVVNIITKTDFDGLQLDAHASVPTHKGGEEFQGSVLWGKTFDRGHIMVALDYFKQNELARGDRSYLSCPPAYIFRKGSNQRADLIDPRTGKYHCEDLPVGQVWTYDFEYNYLGGPGNLRLPNGTFVGPVNLVQFQYPGENLGLPPITGSCGAISCFNAPPGWFFTGYDAHSQSVQNDFNPYANEQTIIPSTKRYTLYADGSYQFSDAVELYGEFLANRRETYQNGWRQFWTFGYTSSGGYCAFFDCYGSGPVPGLGASVWANGWTGLNLLSPTGVTDRGSDSKQRVDYWRGVGGLRGDLGGFLKGWSYDAYVQYSHNKGLYSNEQIMQDVINIAYFQTSSCAGTVTPVSHKQCVDLPWLDPNFLFGKFTPAEANLLFSWETGKTIYKQLSGEASMTGNLFHLPYGPVGLAIGLDARRDDINDTPGAITLAGNAWGASAAGITAGHEITTEAFGEIEVPLLKDVPFFRDLSFNGAARVTNVKAVRASDGFSDSDKANWTYKLGGNWAVTNWLRFRGTYGTSFRAPALFEEFKADETSFPSARTIDPCVNWQFNLDHHNIDQRIANNCAAQGIPPNYGGGSITATDHSSGGIGRLSPETSRAWTASVILTPRFPFLPQTRMSLAADYFNIRVKGEVSQLGAKNIVFGCYDSSDFPNDPLCSLFDRGTQGTDPFAIGNVYDSYINISSQDNRGLDLTALVQQNLGRWGTFTILGNGTRTFINKSQLLPTSPITGVNGDIGNPTFVGDLNFTWKPRGGWTVFWGMEYYGASSSAGKVKDRNKDENGVGSLCFTSAIYGDYCVVASVPAYWYHNASITKEFGSPAHRLELTLGVRNIFDTRPPQVTTLGNAGLPSLIGPVVGTSQYDFLGRRVFFSISQKF